MDLHSYIIKLPIPEREAFAERCETSLGYLMQVAYGNKTCGESLAINIDRESNSLVNCEELRSDVDWTHLRKKYSQQKRRRPPATIT